MKIITKRDNDERECGNEESRGERFKMTKQAQEMVAIKGIRMGNRTNDEKERKYRAVDEIRSEIWN